MSENIPESIPTSADPRSKRAVKKRALTPRSGHAAEVDALFAKPDREIRVPADGPKKGLAPPPEIVANVQGSSAGAGSGEFHVYKASRRREYERTRLMEEEVQKEEDEKAFREKKEEQERKDRERTEKNRAKREKQRARKVKQKKGHKGHSGSGEEITPGPEDARFKKKLAPNVTLSGANDAESDVPNGEEVKSIDETGLVIRDEDE